CSISPRTSLSFRLTSSMSCTLARALHDREILRFALASSSRAEGTRIVMFPRRCALVGVDLQAFDVAAQPFGHDSDLFGSLSGAFHDGLQRSSAHNFAIKTGGYRLQCPASRQRYSSCRKVKRDLLFRYEG